MYSIFTWICDVSARLQTQLVKIILFPAAEHTQKIFSGIIKEVAHCATSFIVISVRSDADTKDRSSGKFLFGFSVARGILHSDHPPASDCVPLI